MDKSVCYLAYTSIIHISKDTLLFVGADESQLQQLKNESDSEVVELELDIGILENIKEHLKPKVENAYIDGLKLIPLASEGIENRAFRIYPQRLEKFTCNNYILKSCKDLSEQDIVIHFYAPVFGVLFKGSGLVLKYGETQNNESKVFNNPSEQRNRNVFKVDLRICLKKKKKLYVVCNVEFAKDGNSKQKCTSEAAKVMIEGKCILDQIAKTAELDNAGAKKLQVFNLQFCGLKGTIIGIRIDKEERGYFECAEKNAALMKAALNQDTSSFGSQEMKDDYTLMKANWPGPKLSSPKVIPPLPTSFLG